MIQKKRHALLVLASRAVRASSARSEHGCRNRLHGKREGFNLALRHFQSRHFQRLGPIWFQSALVVNECTATLDIHRRQRWAVGEVSPSLLPNHAGLALFRANQSVIALQMLKPKFFFYQHTRGVASAEQAHPNGNTSVLCA